MYTTKTLISKRSIFSIFKFSIKYKGNIILEGRVIQRSPKESFKVIKKLLKKNGINLYDCEILIYGQTIRDRKTETRKLGTVWLSLNRINRYYSFL